MGFMSGLNSNDDDDDMVVAEGFANTFDTSQAESSDGKGLTVGKLIEMFSRLDPETPVEPVMVDDQGYPLDVPLTVVGLGENATQPGALVMIFVGTREEWQG